MKNIFKLMIFIIVISFGFINQALAQGQCLDPIEHITIGASLGAISNGKVILPQFTVQVGWVEMGMIWGQDDRKGFRGSLSIPLKTSRMGLLRGIVGTSSMGPLVGIQWQDAVAGRMTFEVFPQSRSVGIRIGF